MNHWSDKIAKLGACDDAVKWLPTQPDAATAWDACERGDWMLWLLGALSGPPESESRRRLVLCCCAVARETLRLVPEGEDRPRLAIETAERWARREDGVTLDDVCKAANAADAAWDAYAAEAAWDAYAAARAAARAADAAAEAAYAAYAAAYAAEAAEAACAALLKRSAMAIAAARAASLKHSADIVREQYPEAPEV